MTNVQMIGVFLILIGSIIFCQQWWSIVGKEVTTGTVTDLIPSTDGEGTAYQVAASFKDREGIARRHLGNWATSNPSFQVGDPIRIMYVRNNPDANYRLTFGAQFGFGWTMIGLGLLILFISYGYQWGDQCLLSRFPNTHD